VGKPRASGQPSRVEKRKSNRFRVAGPVEVRWRGPDGVTFTEEARAKQVNAQGGLLQMKMLPAVGSRVELVNFHSAEAAQARVLGVRRSQEGAVLGVAFEFVIPSETFWGVSLQLQKTNAELFKLEQALKSSGADLRILGGFRDAVDYVRALVGAVQELEESQLQSQETSKGLSLLAAERIRYVTHLCYEIAADLDALEASQETKEIAELHQAVEQLYQPLALPRSSTAKSNA